MGRKKRKPAGESPQKKKKPERSAASDGLAAAHNRLAERLMREAMNRSGIPDTRDADLAKAEDMIFQAYETADVERRTEIAASALAACPYCAEAYVCLGALAASPDDAVPLYRMGVLAGEQALGGAAGLARYEGYFWRALPTRPYLRARLGLAQSLWMTGERGEAVQHCRELLRLDADDHQGVRHLLCSYYLELEYDQQLQELLDAYPEDASAAWAFSRALLAFRREGDSPHATELLQSAHRVNPHVGSYLLDNLSLPDEYPPFTRPGGVSEATAYVFQFMNGWRATHGSVSWARRTLRIKLPDAPPAGRSSLRRLVESVSQLPQHEGEMWQVDLRRMNIAASDEETGSQPWTVIVTCATSDELLKVETYDDSPPSTREVLSCLLEVMLEPRDHQPRRPEVIQVRRKTYLNGWRSRLESLEIQCELLADLAHIEDILSRLDTVARFSDLSGEDLEQRAGNLANLPQDIDDVWQADARRLPTWISEEGVPQRPTGALVASRTAHFILAQRVSLTDPHPKLLWEAVLTAILSPAVGTPHLPGAIEVTCPEFRDLLNGNLEPLNVDCVVQPQLDQLDFIYGELEEGLSHADNMPALIDTPGVTPAHVEGLFDAAARFYTAQPWRQARSDQPIRLRCDRFQTNTWYGVVMGQSGMTLGLALYEDWDLLRSILAQEDNTDRRHAGLSVMFGEPFEIAIRDLDMAAQHDWPIAAPEAHPIVIRMNPGMAIRPPLAWELELAEACLRATPCFLTRKGSGPAKMVVPTSQGEMKLELSWAEE